MLNSVCFMSRDIENLTGFNLHTVPWPTPIVSCSLGVLVGVPPKADPETKIQMQRFTWELIPGSAGKVVGKVKRERVPIKDAFMNRFLLTFRITKLNS